MIEKKDKILIFNAGDSVGNLLFKEFDSRGFKNLSYFDNNIDAEQTFNQKVYLSDIREKEEVEKVVSNTDYIIWSPRLLMKNKADAIWYNIGGLSNILESAVWYKKKVKVFLLQTTEGFEFAEIKMLMNLGEFFNNKDIELYLFENDEHLKDILKKLCEE